MNPDILFRLASSTALLTWLALIIAGFLHPGRTRRTILTTCQFIIPGLLAILYLAVISIHWAGHQGGFGSIQEVQKLFADPWLLLAGWVHYLAFDLFLGCWQVVDSHHSHVPHALVIPCLLLTFMFGPIGFLAYVMLKTIYFRRVPE